MEIAALREIAQRAAQAKCKPLEQDLFSHYVDFKGQLTDDEAGDHGRALKASSRIRMTALQLQWRLSKHFLDQPTDIDVFAAD